jgi:hypothetical protein
MEGRFVPNNAMKNGRKDDMQALCNSHLIVHQLSPRQFFRAAYMWRWNKDIPEQSLEVDVMAFDKYGTVPSYISDYLVHCYGVT